MQILFIIDREIIIILIEIMNKIVPVFNKIIIYTLGHTLFRNVGFLLSLFEQGYIYGFALACT